MVLVSNVGNSNLFAAEGVFRDGAATFSVPAGRYWAAGSFMEASGSVFTENRVAVLPQFTVAGNTTVRLAERAASSKVTMVTPRQAAAEDSDFEIRRPARLGPVQFDAFSDTGISLWIWSAPLAWPPSTPVTSRTSAPSAPKSVSACSVRS